MKSIRIKSILTYLITFSFAVGLLFYLYKDQDINQITQKLGQVKYEWILLSIGLSLVSHMARAYRWNLLLAPLGHRPHVGRTFLAVMTGYVTNLIFPRMGEVSRCGVLNRMDNVPVSSSFGTVVAERIFDFLILLTLVTLAVAVEFDKLSNLLHSIIANIYTLAINYAVFFYIAGTLLLMMTAAAFMLFKRHKDRINDWAVYQKIKKFSTELINGLVSIRKLENKAGFLISTLLIWGTYYFMSYVIVFAVPQTQDLSMWAGLSVLVMGGLGMAAPVQGGIGTYHAMVSSVLLLYGIAQEDGRMFAAILHSSQTLSVIFFGGTSFLTSLLISSSERKKQQANIQAN